MDNNYMMNDDAQQNVGANGGANGGKGLAIASMVCGIISIVMSCCTWLVSVPLAIVAIVLGIMSIKQQRDGKGMAIAGIVCAAVALVLTVVVVVLGAASLAMLDEMGYSY